MISMFPNPATPRISYSLEFDRQSDHLPIQNALNIPSSPDPFSSLGFEFATNGSLKFGQTSAADEQYTSEAVFFQCEEQGEAQGQDRTRPPLPLPFLTPLHLCPPSHSHYGETMVEEQTAEHEDRRMMNESNSKPDKKVQLKPSRSCMRCCSCSIYSKRMCFLLPRSRSANSAAATAQDERRKPLKKQKLARSCSVPPASAIAGLVVPTTSDHSFPLPRKGLPEETVKVAPVLKVQVCHTSRCIPSIFRFGCLSNWGKEKRT